jgi:hypothetical protein
MTTKKELQLAYALAGILLVVGILSYITASFGEPPIPPLRVMYTTVAGNVLFDHKAHFSPGDYSISCQDCHHDSRTYEDYIAGSGGNQSVSEAGMDKTDVDETEHVEMFENGDEAHELCCSCHEQYEAGPVKDDCKGCHVQ